MAVITAIEAQKRNPQRVNVYLDGSFAFGISLSVSVAQELRVGDEISAEKRRELDQDDEIERAFNLALNLLSYRPRSRRELENYFRRRRLDPTVASSVVQRLEDSGLVNDREFARFWVENRQQYRPRGTAALRAEMRQKGLERETIDDALVGAGDEDESALAAGERKARSMAKLDERQYFQKMVAFLQRRGYPYEVASRAAKSLRASASEADAGLDEA